MAASRPLALLCLLLSLLLATQSSRGYDLESLEQELTALGGFEDGIGPGEDFGDYEDKYTTGADGDGEEAPEEEEELPPALQDGNPASHIVGVVDLDDVTFDKVVDGSRKVLIEMYAPWDKACKEVVPLVRELGKKFAKDEGILVAKADVDRFAKLAQRFDITTYTKKRTHKYPLFMLFMPDNPQGERYEGALTLQGVSDFALAATNAGPVESLAPVVAQFMGTWDRARREELLDLLDDQTGSLPQQHHESVAYYHKVMASVLEKGDGYLSKELDRLSGIIGAGNVAAGKLLGFKRRMNILKVFLAAAARDEL